MTTPQQIIELAEKERTKLRKLDADIVTVGSINLDEWAKDPVAVSDFVEAACNTAPDMARRLLRMREIIGDEIHQALKDNLRAKQSCVTLLITDPEAREILALLTEEQLQ